MFKKFTIAIGLILTFGQAHSAVVWDWDGSKLLGAQNVDVNGTLYDVEFVEGSCISLFTGCDDIGDFSFGSEAEVDVALQALFDQVLVDGGAAPSNFDTDPFITNGCDDGFYTSGCLIATPTIDHLDGSMRVAWNHPEDFKDSLAWAAIDIGDDSGRQGLPGATYARWSTSVSPVPVPAAVWLFGTALVGLVGFGRRKSRIAA